MNFEQNKYIQISLVVVLCLLIELLCFGRIFYCPNDMSFAFGGDALFLYFNTTFHTCHGSGLMLESMNYPFGESIFMTDAQGALSILMSTLNNLGIDTCTYSMGIINGMIMYLLPVCAIFLYLIFRRFNVNIYFAMLISVAITIMSPQTFRIVSHYGLSYPFYIPMCIYWSLRKFEVRRWEYRDLLFFLIATFFYLNNPYIGFAGLLFIPIISFVKAIKSKENNLFFYQCFAFTSFIILVGYAVIKWSDPFVNRIKEQSGFFLYDVTFNGMLSSKYGFTNKILSQFISIPASGFENTINFGLVPLLTVALLIIVLIFRIIKKAPVVAKYPSIDYKYILLGAFLLGLIACNGITPALVEDYIKSNFSALLLFKASGRFIWLAYFAICIWVAWWLHYILKYHFPKKIYLVGLLLIASLWTFEAVKGFYDYNEQMSKHGNMFKRTTNWKKYLSKNNINPDDYQAILALPIMQGWASKLTTKLHWRSQYESTTMSLATGLPLVDGMLSRMSLDHAMNIVQLGSHPLIKKNVVEQFPNDKPILVMDMSRKDSLMTNQDYILSRSQQLTKYEFFDMYRLEIDSIRQSPVLDSVKRRYKIKDYGQPLYYNGFNKQNIDEPYRYDKGCHVIQSGKNELFIEVPLKQNRDSINVEISFWTLFTPKHEYTPKFEIQSVGSNKKILQSISVDSQFSKDVSDNWVKITASIQSNIETEKVRILSTSKKNEIIDNLLIRHIATDAVVEQNDSNSILWNNYIIHK